MNFCKFMACQETDHTRRAAWKAKAAEAMQLLVLTNQRLVAWTIKRYHSKTLRPSEDVRDLIAYGNLALQNAVELFDYHVGGRFTTYAVTAIDRRCRRELQRDRQRWSNRTIQFSDESDDETHSSLHIGQMPDGDESHPTDSISNRAQVAMLMKHLTQRHREIVMAYFGLNGPSQSTEQLARRLKLSRTRVSQIVNTALKKLRTVGSIVPGNAFPKTSIGECKGLPKVAPAAYE
jgi:RNA polymerase sigma factor (sigma-70 family)